ncbi:MAG: hypothetical protein GX483_02435 [Actinomycetaceae bacterium]|nr:hypothetical protein [Actinomycetaceae bacterium]
MKRLLHVADAKLLLNESISPLAPYLDDAFANAIASTQRALKLFSPSQHPHLFSIHVRASVRNCLENETLPNGWAVCGDSRKMEQLLLRNEIFGVTLRVLKYSPTQPDQIPIAGDNRARKKAWEQLPLPNFPFKSVPENSADVTNQVFLLLWAPNNLNDPEGGFTLRVVHTLEPGRIGKRTLCDLDILIPRGGIINENSLRFISSNDEEDLFPFDIPDESVLGGELA